jgi:hypothetical protein
MKNFKYYFSFAFLGLMGCQYDFPENATPDPNPGQANFSKMVAVGDAITAGFMDGALYDRGQENSYVNILAEQMKLAGGGEMVQPDINSENGYFSMGPDNTVLGRLVLTVNPTTGAIGPAPIGPGDLPAPYTGDKSQINNYGVPGITLGTALISDTGNPTSPLFNPYYARIASNPGVSTLLGDAAGAMADGGTFFSFWLGNNDVLGYATGGASNPAILTEDAAFQTRLNAALSALLNANPAANGIVMNIPNLNALPHFNLINPLSIQVPASARADLGAGLGQLNAAINGWNAGVNSDPQIPDAIKETLLRPTLSTNFDSYALLILDPTLSEAEIPLPNGETFVIPKIRNLTEDDGVKIPLGAQSSLAQGVGLSPLSPLNDMQYDAVYLTLIEQEEIQAKINSFNGFINAAASENEDRLLLVDINDLMNRVLDGTVSFGNVVLNPSIIPPTGGFSLDGIHPNARAQAFITNLIIEGINEKWGANLPQVNPNSFPGNDLPR